MNKAILVGHLTRDPEKRSTQGGLPITTFTVACQSKVKKEDGTYGADFIKCVAWRQTAEFVSKYFKKGSRIGVTGTIKTGSYEADGRKIPTFEVNVEEVEFGGKETAALKPKGETPEEPKQMSLDEFADLKPVDDIQLPF